MSGTESFISFYERLKADLSGCIDVIIEGESPPESNDNPVDYATFEDGPEDRPKQFISIKLCQLRVITFGRDGKALRSMLSLLDKINAIGNTYGQLTRYKYPDGEDPKAVGTYIARITEISPPISREDNSDQRIITFTLTCNTAVG